MELPNGSAEAQKGSVELAKGSEDPPPPPLGVAKGSVEGPNGSGLGVECACAKGAADGDEDDPTRMLCTPARPPCTGAGLLLAFWADPLGVLRTRTGDFPPPPDPSISSKSTILVGAVVSTSAGLTLSQQLEAEPDEGLNMVCRSAKMVPPRMLLKPLLSSCFLLRRL